MAKLEAHVGTVKETSSEIVKFHVKYANVIAKTQLMKVHCN